MNDEGVAPTIHFGESKVAVMGLRTGEGRMRQQRAQAARRYCTEKRPHGDAGFGPMPPISGQRSLQHGNQVARRGREQAKETMEETKPWEGRRKEKNGHRQRGPIPSEDRPDTYFPDLMYLLYVTLECGLKLTILSR